ncbi:MAG: Membrane MotB of proton-channel complex MotA/MotB [Pseudomonadota bacterium]|jgi:chemotaxis protein MotB
MSSHGGDYENKSLEIQEEVEEGEPWLVSYADMMTLLFGFFVLLYTFASAKVDSTAENWVKVKKELAAYFGGDKSDEKTVDEKGDTKDLYSPNVGINSELQSGSKREKDGVFEQKQDEEVKEQDKNKKIIGGTYVGPDEDLTDSQIGALLKIKKIVDSESSLEIVISSQTLFTGTGNAFSPQGESALDLLCKRIGALRHPFFLGVTSFSQNFETTKGGNPVALRARSAAQMPSDVSVARSRVVLSRLQSCMGSKSKGSRLSAMGVGHIPLPQQLNGVMQSGVIIRVNVAMDF